MINKEENDEDADDDGKTECCEAKEVFLFMHNNVCVDVRARWFLEHLDRCVALDVKDTDLRILNSVFVRLCSAEYLYFYRRMPVVSRTLALQLSDLFRRTEP